MTSLMMISLPVLGFLKCAPGAAVEGDRAELLARQFVAPVLEGALGELHDVALVHQGHRGRSLSIAYWMALRTSRLVPSLETGLMPMPEVSGKRILVDAHLVALRSSMNFLPPACRLPLDAGVDVLGVLAEDHHVGVSGMLDRARHAGEVAHRAQADVEIELWRRATLSERMPPPTGVVSGPLMPTRYLESVERGVRQPLAGGVVGLLARRDLVPVDLALRRRPSRRRRRRRAGRRQMSGPVPSPSMRPPCRAAVASAR
jgi:hypothetical protein